MLIIFVGLRNESIFIKNKSCYEQFCMFLNSKIQQVISWGSSSGTCTTHRGRLFSGITRWITEFWKREIEKLLLVVYLKLNLLSHLVADVISQLRIASSSTWTPNPMFLDNKPRVCPLQLIFECAKVRGSLWTLDLSLSPKRQMIQFQLRHLRGFEFAESVVDQRSWADDQELWWNKRCSCSSRSPSTGAKCWAGSGRTLCQCTRAANQRNWCKFGAGSESTHCSI